MPEYGEPFDPRATFVMLGAVVLFILAAALTLAMAGL